ncbi:MAG: S-adenosyl-l-methionine hydroxide adenosyltransferase family protein [Candidatus Caldatribacteriota bacterium]|nr:S-adenosyl-l-methionine hydroxide adenosyltransferase family protein [Candidatus Caldatribacteriota bacterium]
MKNRRFLNFINCFLLTAFLILVFTFSSFAEVSPNGIIGFLTDWGETDYFVGACKGVMLTIEPELKLVDISHGVTPFNIQEGANTLLYAAREFPEGTVFLAIVDPGVGTERKPLLLVTRNDKYFIAPDNGILTLIMNEMGIKKVYKLENNKYFRPGKISKDFHGRDIFSPVAAHIASGDPISEVGSELNPEELVRLPIKNSKVENNKAIGYVVYINQYGNIIVNITQNDFDALSINLGDSVNVKIGEKTQKIKVGTTYGDVPEGDWVCFIACNEVLEIAINWGNANEFFQTELNSIVELEK